jgi:DNA-binding MltR family transcriptional regulator
MSNFTPKHNTLQFDKKQLINLKTRALRSGAWFRALKRIDRVLIDLTIKVVDNVRSSSLAKSILMLTNKLEYVMKSPFSRRLEKIGLLLAQKIVRRVKK